ncbi:hypothetical protein RBSWK_02988 [Rhodopirellula baltica SWK14]|uniref:Uncharacterized protein n=1 Tax=Rhodopirellula baltica SWK14 TaxID=993516 RepID=L7CHN7_RHOBT|nr:hypothetical protein RBSWK_02988 [Rhodopirellula baltica SWK14]
MTMRSRSRLRPSVDKEEAMAMLMAVQSDLIPEDLVDRRVEPTQGLSRLPGS